MKREMKFAMPSVKERMKASMGAKGAKTANGMAALATAVVVAVKYPYAFFASGFEVPTVNSQNLSQKFSDPNQIMGIVVGLALWICQMVGVGMFIWGIYGYVTARKDGEAEAMNGALGKLISGAVLIGMKGVLKMLGIVS